jgi:predicted RNase H-like HicB family nuclease
MKYMVVIEKGEDSYGAYVPDLPGCVAVGDSKEEVLILIQEAIGLYLEMLQEDGFQIPAPHSMSEYVAGTALISTIQQSDTHWLIVSNEVGLGLVPSLSH